MKKGILFLFMAILFSGCMPKAYDSGRRTLTDPLEPYTLCKFSEELSVVSAVRFPSDITSRPVKTVSGRKDVSIIDGYRILFSYPGTDIFANVKFEMLQPLGYLSDKKSIIEGMEFLASSAKGVKDPLEHGEYLEYEVYALNNRTISGSGPISMYTLFNDTECMVVTVYFLNQKAERRKFQSYEEYLELRDLFLDELMSCVQE
ncbi:MAG TPA: hypothetical protein VHN12_04555 [Geobacteraceae bacterium]|nr:hypothetical protein [Geobacteraceae bacterium]